MPEEPTSIAIAGGWGYIGQKFIESACRLELRTFVFDPAPMPDALAGLPIEVVEDEIRFYALPVDLYHLALHPGHRMVGLERLFQRGGSSLAPLILCEKPMADPADPSHGRWLLERTRASDVVVFFDFIELFDEMTLKVHEYLRGFGHVTLTSIDMWRSKDREDPSNPRNSKLIVPIQYQETVHCIAYVLSLLAHMPRSLEGALDGGVRASGMSQQYCPPNPQDYPVPVDGQLEAELVVSETVVRLHTSFKAGAPLTKRRVLDGMGDGKPFRIEAEHVEGRKYLRINEIQQALQPDADAYEQVIWRSVRWARRFGHDVLTTDLRFPNTSFAWYTYLLSAMLWDCCAEGAAKTAGSAEELWRYAPQYPRHHTGYSDDQAD